MNNKDQKGFTLIEILIVISILVMITTIPTLRLSPSYQQKVIDQFFDQLTDDLLLSQQYALSHSDTVKVYFYSSSSSYRAILVESNTEIISRNYDENITINPNTLGSILVIRSNGNVNKAGTMQVIYGQEKYNVVFQLGRGRFYVIKV
ncbi:competence type IV pilus minor pilin ComGD [Litchfieldia salsa]|uniref:Competence protein ComGD n=1 Tax=Litchfieldia salsa TaxID=930152 RepID=A0A1H0VE39_9BACI|nr:competence type IV pilus minor pilin ComGD [Litchfieldia salsa]SDP76356.1 competence protein ComGD [Litchfieldia salsa]